MGLPNDVFNDCKFRPDFREKKRLLNIKLGVNCFQMVIEAVRKADLIPVRPLNGLAF